MSKVTKLKHLQYEALRDELRLPERWQSVVQVVKSVGNNLHQVITPTGDQYLVTMPSKFRRSMWIKRGSFVLVEPLELRSVRTRAVTAEIIKILNEDDIKYYKEANMWPEEFMDKGKNCLNREDLGGNTNKKTTGAPRECRQK